MIRFIHFSLILVWGVCHSLWALPLLRNGDLRSCRLELLSEGLHFEVGSKSAAEIDEMTVKEVLRSVRGPIAQVKDKFENCDILRQPPSVCKFVIANPKAFFENPAIAAFHGFDCDSINPSTPLFELAQKLPVIYIADSHPEYGTLGFSLHRPSGKTVGDLHPELRALRERVVYSGGEGNKGSSFTMVHQKSGFPENRKWKGIPGDSEFRLFFSPELAMANELCMTGDATPHDFKFFQWATIWAPKQLELEYSKKLWLTVKAPTRVIFDDLTKTLPLWRKIVASLPEERLA